MNKKPVEPPPAVTEGPILSNRPAYETTIWRDGDVVRRDAWGRLKSLPSATPLPDNSAGGKIFAA